MISKELHRCYDAVLSRTLTLNLDLAEFEALLCHLLDITFIDFINFHVWTIVSYIILKYVGHTVGIQYIYFVMQNQICKGQSH